ncbi:MAG TPA: HAMP domain-containing sensor histidine kinase [Candidatus Baltobacteraceae bacterium]|jgi:signal transduction histidine kinase|nr:HAMP domain-containing sensor histidine kinase [Candidatus Baltobacteraceae bacterium]
MTLGSRLSATYAAVILFSLLLFAAVAIIAIDRTMNAGLDARLATDGRALASLVDIKRGEVVADEEDRRQFLTIIGAGDQGLVADKNGTLKLSSVLRPPPALLSLPSDRQGYYTAGSNEAQLRAFVFPLVHKGKPVATVIVWRASDWIQQTDRGAAIAFAAAAIVIAGLALLAGGAVTRRALGDAFARQRRFTADASHELRTPLAVIRAEADLALRRQRTSDEYRAAMQMIASEADRIEALIGDLLSAARAERGELRREDVDLEQRVQAVASRLAPAAAAKDATVAVRSDPHVVVRADSQSIERALLAVGHNAVKYAPPRGVIDFAVHRRHGFVEVIVRDNGPGFSENALQHATERFWRDADGGSAAGTGLGLAIARSAVEAAGGTITLENPAGHGAVVRLRFPMAAHSG